MSSPEAASRPPREYAVFISYRHEDNKQPGRQWASWLHHALETYEVPRDLAGTRNTRGETIPPSLYPVFRDEEELPADADLGTHIRTALQRSRLLVVFCSPRAVASSASGQDKIATPFATSRCSSRRRNCACARSDKGPHSARASRPRSTRPANQKIRPRD